MKQVVLTRAGVSVEDAPSPAVKPGAVLVALEYSCISVGTEMSGVREISKPVWRRLAEKPQELKRAADVVRREGLTRTRAIVRSRLRALSPVGYSAAGRVLEVGDGVTDIKAGDRVACAGSEWAFHAQVVCVPRNLLVPIPQDLDARAASLVTLGAIALQGVRRANPTLGEVFAVIGLGILGQLAQQMLQAHGARVIGLDLDPRRIDIARGNGMEAGFVPGDIDAVAQCMRLTGGIGVDGVVVCAASSSNAILSQAFAICRRKARVVVVGDVGLGINRADIYRKELDFLISTSYGPGRYDKGYEEKGLDYPIGYVRWTENRNLAEVLRLMAAGQIRPDTLLEADYPVEKASEAYAALSHARDKAPLVVTLSYPEHVTSTSPRVCRVEAAVRTRGPSKGERIRLGIIGAGGFAQSMLLPILEQQSAHVSIRAIATMHGHTALGLAQRWGAETATTDHAEILVDPSIDAVLIATRHDLHARLALAALRSGKAVFVEKPLCVTRAELSEIEGFFAEGGDMPVLMTGFNRRFSPHAAAIAGLLQQRSNPMIVNYRVNAGWMDTQHWVHGPEGGGRNIGEACHFYDFFTFLTEARAVSVDARAIHPRTSYYRRNDNFVATVSFADGSVATLTYTALGASEHPKERVEIYCDGAVIEMEDFRTLSVAGRKGPALDRARIDKGHEAGVLAFLKAVRGGTAPPIPIWQQLQATTLALDVEEAILKS